MAIDSGSSSDSGISTPTVVCYNYFHIFLYFKTATGENLIIGCYNTQQITPNSSASQLVGVSYTLNLYRTDDSELKVDLVRTTISGETSTITTTTLTSTGLFDSGSVTIDRNDDTTVSQSYWSIPSKPLYRNGSWKFYKVINSSGLKTDLGTSLTITADNVTNYGYSGTSLVTFKIFIEYDSPTKDLVITNNYRVLGNYFTDNNTDTEYSGLPLDYSYSDKSTVTADYFTEPENTSAVEVKPSSTSTHDMIANDFVEAVGDYDVFSPGSHVKAITSGNPVVASGTLPTLYLRCNYGYTIYPTTQSVGGEVFDTSTQKTNYATLIISGSPNLYSINPVSRYTTPSFVSATYTAYTSDETLKGAITVKNNSDTALYLHLVTNWNTSTHYISTSAIAKNGTYTFPEVPVTDSDDDTSTVFIFGTPTNVSSWDYLKASTPILAIDYDGDGDYNHKAWHIDSKDIGLIDYEEVYYVDYA